jgi:16S rRNA (adenine1518-N6/adenine1519-N6)-dimethyltransferase
MHWQATGKSGGTEMTTIDGLPPLREVIARHELMARKSLGQNFLLDLNLTAKIARLAGDLGECDVLEVGPGPGGLTRGLLSEGARRVLAVEKDTRCLPALQEIADAWPGKLEVVSGDAMHIDALAHLTPPEWPPVWQSLTLMFQREVAQRIVAQPGSKAYGRLALLAQWRCDAHIVMTLPPEAFSPPPKVHSSVVHLTALPVPRFPANAAILNRVIAAGFNQRRKMLRSSLKSLSPGIEAILEKANIAPTSRAEEISLESFCRLARKIEGEN